MKSMQLRSMLPWKAYETTFYAAGKLVQQSRVASTARVLIA